MGPPAAGCHCPAGPAAAPAAGGAPAPMKNCASFKGTCPADTTQFFDLSCVDLDTDQYPDACTADHCCHKMCSSFAGECPAGSKKNNHESCHNHGKTSCDATTCCEYNRKTSFVGTCIGDTEVIDKSPAIKDGKITFTGADPKQMPAADYWKWNGDEKKDLGVSASDSCCQKTCELDKCTANGNFDDDCGKDGPCPAACDLGGESTSDDLDKCAECSMKTKNEWCGGCLQCLHDLHLKYDSDTKKIKSDWKVKAKVEEKAPAPTPKPKSKLPTFAPTPKPTNPKKP